MTDVYAGIRTRENIVEADEYSPGVRVLAGGMIPSSHANVVPAAGLTVDQEVTALRQLIADMEHDWRALNEFFNTTAVNRRWCTEYEERLRNYNASFRVLRMVGRPENWVGSSSSWIEPDGGRRTQWAGED